MRKLLIGLSLSLVFAPAIAAQETAAAETAVAANPKVTLTTSKGAIVVELFADKAPKSVANFLAYAESGYYEGTVFHRVIPDFMVQGGGFGGDLVKKSTRDPVENEADNGLKNDRGTLAMARTNDPHSATSQFFINSVNNDFLNHRNKSTRGWGYAVFGKVVEGMAVVDAITAVRTGNRKGMQNVPLQPVTIDKVTIEK
ncbi:MAG: peptidylprolyl isomerase [Acidobacteriota bacterium]